jgi:hypothetical protein
VYVVIAEDSSDLNCLKVLIRRLANDNKVRITGKGYSSCGDMLNKGAAQLKLQDELGCHKFIICHDRDKESTQKRYEKVVSSIIKPAKINKPENSICIVIPTEEIEAWILADIHAVSLVFSSWIPKNNYLNPEEIINPKEVLRKLSGENKPRPLYSHNMHNEKVMQYIDLEIVKKKCRSFVELANFIERGISNYPERIN